MSEFELATTKFMEFITKDEIEVANILINLPNLISKSLSPYRFSYRWVSKRRRSVLDSPEKAAPPPPPPPAAIPVETAAKPEASSPNTPLSFYPPTESDTKSKQFSKRKTSVKRTKEELVQIIDERIQTQQDLKERIEKVKNDLDKLMAENLDLKAKKQRLIQSLDMKREKAQLYDVPVSDHVPVGPSTSTHFPHHIPLIHHQLNNPTVHIDAELGGQIGYHQPQVGPFGFDLNVSAEDTVAMEYLQPLDQELVRKMMMKRAYDAQAKAARQRRIYMNKMKKRRV